MNPAAEGLTEILRVLTPIFMIVGVVVSLGGLIGYFVSSRRGEYTSTSSLLLPVVIGGLIMFTPMLIPLILTMLTGVWNGEIEEEPSDTPSPTQTPTSEPTSTPTQTPEAPAEPFTVPGAVWIAAFVFAGLIALAVVYLLVVHSTRVARKMAEEKRQKMKMLSAAQDRWDTFVAEAREIRSQIVAFESDWDVLFSTPSLLDPRVPQTGRMYEALVALSDISEVMPADITSEVEVRKAEFPRAVIALRSARDTAVAAAEKLKLSGITKVERDLLLEGQRLLAMAQNQGGNENERALAYQRLQRILGKLQEVVIPKRLALAIEEGEREIRQITA